MTSARLPQSKLDVWNSTALQLYCQAEVEVRIRAKAVKLAAECRRLRASGLQVPLLEVDDLINHVWTIALKTRPAFPDRIGMILYFWRRMENHFKEKCRKSPGAHIRGLPIGAEAEGTAQTQFNITSIEKFRADEVQRENAEALRGFRAYLSLHDNALVPLLELVTDCEITNAREQAKKLDLQVKEIYRLRARLQLHAKQYGLSLTSKR